MKNPSLFFAVLFCAAAVQAAPQADLIARIHFAGVEKISADMNSLAFTNEFCSAEAQALKMQTLDKLSVALDGWLKQKIGANVPYGAAKLRPLLDDLQKYPCFLEARVASNGKPEVALAVKLNDSRAQFWRANLQPFFPTATFKQSAGWLVFNCAGDSLKLGDSLGKKISTADNVWLDIDLNWSRLAQFSPALKVFGFSETHLQVIGRDGNFQMDGKFILSQPLSSPLAQWRMPTNAIRQPLVSFTAARGFAPWLARQNLPYEISPVPDQVFIWALAQNPFQTFAAVPVPNAENALAQLGEKMSDDTNWQHHFITPFPMAVSSNQISWQCGPFMIMPNVTALHEPSGDFLFAGAFPNGPRKKQPLPPELFTRLAQPGLVYYHWEITAERLQELPQFSQLVLMLTKHQQVNVQSAAGKWLDKIEPTLGNTVTEVFQTAPDELTFNRKSPGGLNALELLAFVDWLDAPNFPAFDLALPPMRP
ncbi:MAG TPA: hypothetical protein VK810_00435, partial [Dongiaceae bacterium]|nr:hypothetical protein [Dongiaceae bacterium]